MNHSIHPSIRPVCLSSLSQLVIYEPRQDHSQSAGQSLSLIVSRLVSQLISQSMRTSRLALQDEQLVDLSAGSCVSKSINQS